MKPDPSREPEQGWPFLPMPVIYFALAVMLAAVIGVFILFQKFARAVDSLPTTILGAILFLVAIVGGWFLGFWMAWQHCKEKIWEADEKANGLEHENQSFRSRLAQIEAAAKAAPPPPPRFEEIFDSVDAGHRVTSLQFLLEQIADVEKFSPAEGEQRIKDYVADLKAHNPDDEKHVAKCDRLQRSLIDMLGQRHAAKLGGDGEGVLKRRLRKALAEHQDAEEVSREAHAVIDQEESDPFRRNRRKQAVDRLIADILREQASG